MYKLRVANDVATLLAHLHPDLKRKVRAALEAILADPHTGKALKDELQGLRSFRIGKFRLIYRLRHRQIDLVAFGARERIYEETYQLISRPERSGGVEEPRRRYRVSIPAPAKRRAKVRARSRS